MWGKNRLYFILLFSASGFAGFIYESIWTEYLKLILGHAVIAQTLIFALYMGGMALGSFFISHFSKRLRNLLLGYAVVEAILGVCAVLFHSLFIQYLELTSSKLIPQLASPSIIFILKLTTAGLFILSQSTLLGMAFPLMTSGVVRRFPAQSGSTIALLYFSNSIGAAMGIIASGFLFIAWSGMPGTLIISGVVNLAIAAIIWSRVREDFSYTEQTLLKDQPPVTSSGFDYRVLLIAALLIGASSFIYQIGWMRMLSLVLSSSTHAHELMLSAFLAGFALGGLWISRRIDSLDHPIKFLAIIPVAMGVFALATLPIYGHLFEVMAWLVKSLPKSINGYVLFNITNYAIALAIMLPSTFFAGMILPLITAILLRDGKGEKSIGAVYALNMVGCIIGFLFAVHVAMPVFGLKFMIGFGAGINLLLGLTLTWWAIPSLSTRLAVMATAGAIFLAALLGVQFDLNMLVSGVYRSGDLHDQRDQKVVYYHDGKTATVSVTKLKALTSIRTNGKTDAAIALPGNSATADEENLVLLGVMPLAMHPRARTAANIGWGAGLTTNTLLSSRQLERVDIIEIEPDMIEAAKYFRPRVELAYTDPRSHIYIEDPRTFFPLYGNTYDIIVSEPSSPWVSGVAGLFSQEYYRMIKEHLNKDGLFVQWIQMDEIDMPQVASVFNALSSQFADYVVYASNHSDMIIVARANGTVPEPDRAVLSEDGISNELKHVGIQGPQDVSVRRIGNRSFLEPLFDTYLIPANSDYYSVVDLYAARSRFLGTNSMDLFTNELSLLPVQMLSHEPVVGNEAAVSYSHSERARRIHLASTLREYILHDRWIWDHPDAPLSEDVRMRADKIKKILSDCSGKSLVAQDWKDGMYYGLSENILPYSTPRQLNDLWQRFESSSCWSRLPAFSRNYITLIKAIGKRDATNMSQTARILLKEMDFASPPLQQYVLSAALLGDLSDGKVKEASSLIRQYGFLSERDYQSVLMRLLAGHAIKASEYHQSRMNSKSDR